MINDIIAKGQEPTTCSNYGWYALFVKTGAELKLLDALKKRYQASLGFHVPRREMRIRRQGEWILETKPMFPGYILVNGELTRESASHIKRINDVYKWVSDERGPLAIPEYEITLIRSLIRDDDVIHQSRAYYEGQKIVIVDGPLVGNEAIIRKVDRRKQRVKVAIPLFGQERLIDISLDFIDNWNTLSY